jgi:hypothetical protein
LIIVALLNLKRAKLRQFIFNLGKYWFLLSGTQAFPTAREKYIDRYTIIAQIKKKEKLADRGN